MSNSKIEVMPKRHVFSQWARQQARTIRQHLDQFHGTGWRGLVSDSTAQGIEAEKVLALVMSQAMEKYGPAQELIRDMMDALDSLEGRD